MGVVAALSAFLLFGYIASHNAPGPMTETQANGMLDTLKEAVAHKNANAILALVSPDPETRIKDMSPDKLRTLLFQAFRNADNLDAQTANVKFQGGEESASLEYDLTIHHTMQSAVSEYKYHIMMQMRPIDASHFLGLYHTKEWRITGAQADGPDLGGFME